jgi:thioredoxin-dependent peroxiredoxin
MTKQSKNNPLAITNNPLDRVFLISLLIKGIDGLAEAIAGVILCFVNTAQIDHIAIFLTRRELTKDPDDFIANAILHASNGFTDHVRYFLIVYLFIHAAIKLISVVGILRSKRWAYPFALITLGLLTIYQIYEIIIHHSPFMVALTIFDIFILWLIRREYREKVLKKRYTKYMDVPFKAPAFTLPNEKGDSVSLSDFKDKWVVLYFYPKDETPGCTAEACSLRDSRDDLAELGAEVVGISKDDASSHDKFKAKYQLNFTLLTDKDGKVIEKYGAWGKKMFGKEGILRKTFIIDPKGQVVKVYGRVTPIGHGEQVIEELKKLQKS